MAYYKYKKIGKHFIQVPSTICISCNNFPYSKIIGLETTTNLTMYPNPISAKEKQLNIHIKEKLYTGLNVSIIDMNGKVVYEIFLAKEQGNVYRLTFSPELPQGIYFVYLKTNNQLITRKLLIF